MTPRPGSGGQRGRGWHRGGHGPQPGPLGTSRASAAGGVRARPWSAGPRADPDRSPGAPPTLRRGRLPWGRGGLGSGGVTGRAVCGPAAEATVTGGGGEAGGARGSPRGRGCCGLAERSAARRGRADGGLRATASQRRTARPAALRSRGALVAGPGPWTSGEGEEALPAWAPAPGRSPRASRPPARGL